MSEPYVELHCHSCFSLLDGGSTPEALLDRAAELAMPALALTDHDGLYAAIRFSLAARERGITPIIGAELTLTEDPALAPTSHLLLLAEDRRGYRNLSRLISRAQLNGTKGHPTLAFDDLEGNTAGLIALTGCCQGRVAALLRSGDAPGALAALSALRELFGPHHVYVELQRHYHPGDEALAHALAACAHRVGLPVVATNNVHYARRQDRRLQDVLVAIRHNMPVHACRTLLRPNSEYYLKSAAEMQPLFAAYPAALANTVEIATRCRVELYFRDEAASPPDTETDAPPDARLAALCLARLPHLYPRDPTRAEAQLRHELDVIRQTDLASYFLLVWDIVHFAKQQGIQVRGRGSAANSIVAYLLGITNVDPLAHGLLFERFLSAEARVMPDIDLDFCARRREEVIQYVYHKYGEAHVGMVCNYVTYRARSAVRDVGKALGLPAELIDLLAKSQGKWGVRSAGYDPEEEAERYGVPMQLWEQFVDLQSAIQGYPRHLSIHTGGMIITRSRLDEVVPLERATMPGRVVVQWDKDNVEDAGLIKLDLLSLRTLSAIDECLRTIEETRGVRIDLDALPLDDPAVYHQLQRADTIGAFQVESRAQQQALVQMKPRCFSDIVIEVALIRPGPLQGNMVHPFFQRRNNRQPVTYPHPLLEPILAETLGVVVFQEQIIRIAMVMGRFSAGEADMLRRAMSRHRSEDAMAAFRRRFVAGARAQGVSEEVADDVFGKLMGFASYGFCKSHAAAFAKTAYDTLYLRAYYPAEYYCAILNNEPMGFYAPRVVVSDARHHGVTILPINVNCSDEPCTVEGGGIRLGLRYVDGLGEVGAGRVVEARPPHSYTGLGDLCRRTRLPRRLVENLILAGALSDWSRDRRALLWELGRLRYREDELPIPLAPDGVTLEAMSYAEELMGEYAATGMAAEGHLMELFREQLRGANVCTSAELERVGAGQRVRTAGMVAVRQAPPTAKGFAFFTLEDEWGMINVIVRPDIFEVQRETYVSASVLMVQGTVQRAHGQTNLIAEQSWRLR
jgi:error-prone DNA polymerase